MTAPQAPVRARLALAVAARELADEARGVIGGLVRELPTGASIRAARRLRSLAMAVIDSAVLMEVAAGATWDDLADSLGLTAQEAARRYDDVVRIWLRDADSPRLDLNVFGERGATLHPDVDPVGLAESLSQWFERHSEPWEESERIELL